MASSRLKKSTIEVRGETFTFREWTGAERAEFHKRSKDDALRGVFYIVHKCTLTEDGKPLWPNEAAVSEEPTEITDAIGNAIAKLSGMTTEEGGGEKNA